MSPSPTSASLTSSNRSSINQDPTSSTDSMIDTYVRTYVRTVCTHVSTYLLMFSSTFPPSVLLLLLLLTNQIKFRMKEDFSAGHLGGCVCVSQAGESDARPGMRGSGRGARVTWAEGLGTHTKQVLGLRITKGSTKKKKKKKKKTQLGKTNKEELDLGLKEKPNRKNNNWG